MSWECRTRIVKQNPFKFTERRPTKYDGFTLPAPNRYAPPSLIGGKGFSRIKQAPKYTFGLRTPLLSEKPPTYNPQMYNIRGLCNKGREHIPLGTILERHEPPGSKNIIPGPGAYDGNIMVAKKQPPAYSLFPRAKPPYEPWDMWTPSPNMYLPPFMIGNHLVIYGIIMVTKKQPPAYSLFPYEPWDIWDISPNMYLPPIMTGNLFPRAKPPYEPWDTSMWTPSPNMYLPPIMTGKKAPAYSLTKQRVVKYDNKLPGPGDFSPNFDVTKRRIPAFSFRLKTQIKGDNVRPAPNAYCEKKFDYPRRRATAPSFGIKHSIYLGKPREYLQPSVLNTRGK